MRQISLFLIGLLCPLMAVAGKVASPNGKLTAVTNGKTLTISYKDKPVLDVEDAVADGQPLAFVRKVTADYQMLTGKRSHCTNEANEYRCGNMLLRMYNDGIAFRYEGQQQFATPHSAPQRTANSQQPAYRIPEGTRRWMQQWCDSYEGFFPLETTYKVTPVPSYSGISKSAEGWNNRWGYPALIELTPSNLPQKGEAVYALITEANIEHGQSASCLYNDGELFRVTPAASVAGKTCDHSPWRVAMIGQLKDIVE